MSPGRTKKQAVRMRTGRRPVPPTDIQEDRYYTGKHTLFRQIHTGMKTTYLQVARHRRLGKKQVAEIIPVGRHNASWQTNGKTLYK